MFVFEELPNHYDAATYSYYFDTNGEAIEILQF